MSAYARYGRQLSASLAAFAGLPSSRQALDRAAQAEVGRQERVGVAQRPAARRSPRSTGRSPAARGAACVPAARSTVAPSKPGLRPGPRRARAARAGESRASPGARIRVGECARAREQMRDASERVAQRPRRSRRPACLPGSRRRRARPAGRERRGTRSRPGRRDRARAGRGSRGSAARSADRPAARRTRPPGRRRDRTGRATARRRSAHRCARRAGSEPGVRPSPGASSRMPAPGRRSAAPVGAVDDLLDPGDGTARQVRDHALGVHRRAIRQLDVDHRGHVGIFTPRARSSEATCAPRCPRRRTCGRRRRSSSSATSARSCS